MARPRQRDHKFVSDNGTSPQPTSFWLDPKTREVLDQMTKELGMKRSAVVREAIRRMAADDHSAEVRRLVAELSRVVAGGGDE